MSVLFLMVTTIPDMLPHNGDHCGEGQPDVRAVHDGLKFSTIPDMLPHDGDHYGEGQPDVRTVPDGLHYT